MSIPLPNVISSITNAVSSVVQASAPIVVPNESIPIVVIISKDLSERSLAQFQKYGKCTIWEESMVNIP